MELGGYMELTTINKLFLELSQITTAKTAREIELEGRLAKDQDIKLSDLLEAIKRKEKQLLFDKVNLLSVHINSDGSGNVLVFGYRPFYFENIQGLFDILNDEEKP